MKHITVVAAVIELDNKILCMQRNLAKFDYVSYKYEFPGGKIEEGETCEEALRREIMEEMDYEIEVGDLILTVNHQYPDFFITMHVYHCKVETAEFIMREHIAFKWLLRNELFTLDWAAADLPVVDILINQIN